MHHRCAGTIQMKFVVVCLRNLRVRGCIQKFPDWPPVARTANGAPLCHLVQLYRYFVSQYSEFCRHNSIASERVFIIVVDFVIDSVRKILDTPAYVLVQSNKFNNARRFKHL
jgi:hypothetical protein